MFLNAVSTSVLLKFKPSFDHDNCFVYVFYLVLIMSASLSLLHVLYII